jgi:hypothetical protein
MEQRPEMVVRSSSAGSPISSPEGLCEFYIPLKQQLSGSLTEVSAENGERMVL